MLVFWSTLHSFTKSVFSTIKGAAVSDTNGFLITFKTQMINSLSVDNDLTKKTFVIRLKFLTTAKSIDPVFYPASIYDIVVLEVISEVTGQINWFTSCTDINPIAIGIPIVIAPLDIECLFSILRFFNFCY